MRKITFLLLLVGATAFAQWTTDTAANTLVASSVSDDTKAIGTSDGKTYVVFWKVVPAPANYELRAQLLDALGNQLWGADGVLVSNTIPMSTSTVTWKVTIDAANNLYIAVTGTGTGTPALIFKVDTAGANLWTSAGLLVGSGYVPTVLPLSGGEVMVSYMPVSGKAKLQRYTSSGIPVWGAAVDIVGGSASANTVPADMFETGDGGVTMVFHQRAGFGVASTLFAQRYNSGGVAQWAVPTQLSNKGTAYNATYGGVSDGDIVYYGYTGSTGTRFDGFVQRVNSDGTMPWGINGADFDTNQTLYEMDTKIAFAPGSAAVWAIARYTPSTQDLYGEYVQKFDKVSGARLLGENAKEVFPVDNNYRNHTGDLNLANDRPLFLVKQGLDNGASPVTLGAVLLDSAGDLAFTPSILPVGTYPASKGRVALTKPYNGQAVAVFTEQKTAGQTKIYAQQITNLLLSTKKNSVTNEITIYPNPSSGAVNFRIAQTLAGAEANVYNLAGQLVKSFVISSQASMQFSAGVYVIKIISDNGTFTDKFIVN